MALLDDSDGFGNAFGGAGTSLLQPFLGQQGMDAARANALMNIGAQMMAASAPSFDPSHRSLGYAVGQGLTAGQQAYQQGMQRGLANAGAAMSLQQNKMLYDLVRQSLGAGGPATAATTASAAPGAPSYSPTAGLPGGGTPTMGYGADTSQPAAPAAASAPASLAPQVGGPLAPGGSLNPAGMPTQLAAMGLLGDRNEYFKQQMGAYSPTDLMKYMRSIGIDPSSPVGQRIINAEIARTTAPQITRLSNGSYVQNGEFVPVPNAEGMISTKDANGNWTMSAVPGAAAAQAELSQAKASGPATFKTVQTYNPQTKQFENTPQTVNAQRAGAYAPGGSLAPQPGMLPAPLRNNNPGALMTGPGGTLGRYPTVQEGMAQMDKQLQLYGSRDGLNTISGIVGKWNPPNGKGNTPAGTQAYIADVAQQLGIDPNAPINMADPATRQQLALAMANHENGRAAMAASGVQAGGAPGAGPMPATPPLGTTQREQASQEAAAASMKKDFEGMQSFRSAAPMQLGALQRMLELAQHKTIFTTGPLGDTELAQDINPSAAEYEKQRGNYLATAGAVGTDAQRATQAHAVPDYGKPQSAIIDGLHTQVNQVQHGMLRAQFLTPAYNAGDATKYTTDANAFDQHITPAMMPVLSQSGDAAKAAYRALIAKNPSLKSNFQWALDNGLLK